MPLDCHFLDCLRQELSAQLLGARVEKIHHPAKDDVVLRLRTREGKFALLLCVAAGRARAGLLTRPAENENPAQPSMLCMLLRKHLQGAVLSGLRRQPNDRILYFDFDGTDDLGDKTRRTLCLELFGRSPNLLLLKKNDVIVEALHRSDILQAQAQGGRLLQPGAAYQPPAPPPGNNPPPPWPCRPALWRGSNGVPVGFGCAGTEEPGEIIESYSLALELFYAERDAAARQKQLAGTLQKSLENRLARTLRKLEAQKQELAQAQNREPLRVMAELILANQATLPKGATAYRLPNYYNDNRTLHIPVDPALGPAQNAQRYYKRYQKAKRAAALLGDLITQSAAEADYLAGMLDFLRRAQSRAELDALKAELEEQGFCCGKKQDVKDKKPGAKKAKAKALPPMEYTTSEGLRVLAGRNNLQNDFLTFRTAKGGDWWFHAQGIPGSHVILCAEGKAEPGPKSTEEAALLAAWHSQAQGPAAVDYTQAKHLKKPAGARPGQVIYHTYRTILAKPTNEIIELLTKGAQDGRT